MDRQLGVLLTTVMDIYHIINSFGAIISNMKQSAHYLLIDNYDRLQFEFLLRLDIYGQRFFSGMLYFSFRVSSGV